MPPPTAVQPAAVLTSPLAMAPRESVSHAREVLEDVVQRHGLDPALPWATGHALLALGPEAVMPDGTSAIDHLFSTWAEVTQGPEGPEISFPARRGRVLVEPHAALMFKVLADLGVSPDRRVIVQGEELTLRALYRGVYRSTWLSRGLPSFGSWNDVPWALHGLSLWSPSAASWSARNGQVTHLDDLSHAVVVHLGEQTAFLSDVRQAQQAGDREGATLVKRGQGIFAYTCGGAHLLQGAATAVAAGFGREGDRDLMAAQAELMLWRFEAELAIVDAALAQYEEHRLVLTTQRLKFVGHTLETLHRLAAQGFLQPSEALRQSLMRVEDELVRTVDMLELSGAFRRMSELRASSAEISGRSANQIYLDLVGDAAHAIRGIDLATGRVGLAH